MQKGGRSANPNRAHFLSKLKCTHHSPAALPWGMPEKGVVIEGAIQHAPHSLRHGMVEDVSGCCTLSPVIGF